MRSKGPRRNAHLACNFSWLSPWELLDCNEYGAHCRSISAVRSSRAAWRSSEEPDRRGSLDLSAACARPENCERDGAGGARRHLEEAGELVGGAIVLEA